MIVSFPPGAGGNHLRNLISLGYSNNEIANIYQSSNMIAHASLGNNLTAKQIQAAILLPNETHLLHGHFGEILTYQESIRSISDKKFILISADTPEERSMLNQRRRAIGYPYIADGNYFDGEQVFLYEHTTYCYYFNIAEDAVINVSLNELFSENIKTVIDRINNFLSISIDYEQVKQLHQRWIFKNNAAGSMQ